MSDEKLQSRIKGYRGLDFRIMICFVFESPSVDGGHDPAFVSAPHTRCTARHRLWQRLLAQGVIPSERCVQRPPRSLLHGSPRSRPPTEDLANPRPHEMAPVKEGRPPAALVAGE